MMNPKELGIYLVVGVIATVVEWVFFWLFDHWTHYMLATCCAFAVSTLANWAAGRVLLFGDSGKGLARELAEVYAASVAGLFMNLAIMWVTVEALSVPDFVGKITATGIVFFWNFLIRRLVIYQK